MFTLYSNEISVCAQKVRIVLHEKGASWDHRELDILKKENLKPDYLELNPTGVVPTLVHDGKVVIESTIICEYLDDVIAAPALRPRDPYECAMMRIWTKMTDVAVHWAIGRITWATSVRELFLNNAALDPEEVFAKIPDRTRRKLQMESLNHGLDHPAVGEAVLEIDRTLERMEKSLAASGWLAGADYSLADIGLAPYVHRLADLRMEGFWEDRPNVADWYARVSGRAAFGKAVIEGAPQDWNDLMAARGASAWNTLAEHRLSA